MEFIHSLNLLMFHHDEMIDSLPVPAVRAKGQQYWLPELDQLSIPGGKIEHGKGA